MKLLSRPTKKGLSHKAKMAAAILALEIAEQEAAQRAATEAEAWTPDPGPQTAAYNSLADVIGYGGAAGGGKSDLIIGLAATQHHKSIIFRREYPQIRDIIARAKEITASYRVGFNGSSGMLTLPEGATIEFGSMKDPDSWENYKGRPHDLKAYDEATEFLESQVRSTMGWLRTVREGQRTRVLMTFNPPTNTAGMWVVRFFSPWLDPDHPRPAKPGELRWYAMIDGQEVECEDGETFAHFGEEIQPTSRTFFPARLADNPRLMKTGYGRQLNSLPEPLRSQLLYGDFRAGMGVDPWQMLPSAWVEAAQARWVALKAAGYQPGPMDVLGFDVAHGGKDKTAFAPRHGVWFAPVKSYAGKETPDGMSAAKIAMRILRDGAYTNVDAIGYGASAQERLADMPPDGYGVRAQAINVGCRSEFRDKSKKFRCVNVRAEMYWRLRELLDPENGHEPALPPGANLKAELCAGRYEITPQGIKFESKDDIKERLGHSPDEADAVALAMLPDGTSQRGAVGGPITPFQQIPSMTMAPPPKGIPGSLR
ncbi:terminase family protein [Singulisphaera sp. Ch08]|uniref:Terminase family protein n=1 Tax=Singulisphaera sp. Ch08 TaxID=3120278 RepID=A0AAU7CKS7_9BACT